jgi:hypothetical protein
MASAGTLLSELDAGGNPNAQDSDIVEKILHDMNSGNGGNSVQMPGRGMAAPPPPLPSQGPPGVPMGTSFPQAADPMTAQAHVIGKEHPTPGDFAAAMYGMNRTPDAALYDNGGGGRQTSSEEYTYEEPTKKNLYARVLDEAKTPLIIAILFFVISLPAVNVLVAHYLPSLILPTGALNMIGLGAKALLAGIAFWILQRVVAPLLKA